MPWFTYHMNELKPVEPIRGYTIEELVRNGLEVAKQYGEVIRACYTEEPLVIEYELRNGLTVKLINAKDLTKALVRCYEVENQRRCTDLGQLPNQ